MQWQDDAIILSARKFGEGSAIVTLLSAEHGVYRAMVRSISGKKNRAIYQAGNVVEATWTGRLSEQLGSFSAEVSGAFSALVLSSNINLLALCSACALVERCLPEREPHPHMFMILSEFLEQLVSGEDWAIMYVQFELELLQELGFGLDLSVCAATGEVDDLIYVSPRSGRAVSRTAGEPYHAKMLPLPAFLLENTSQVPKTVDEIKNGLALTGFFLNKYMFEPHHWQMPEVRSRLVAAMIEKEQKIQQKESL